MTLQMFVYHAWVKTSIDGDFIITHPYKFLLYFTAITFPDDVDRIQFNSCL